MYVCVCVQICCGWFARGLVISPLLMLVHQILPHLRTILIGVVIVDRNLKKGGSTPSLYFTLVPLPVHGLPVVSGVHAGESTSVVLRL